MELVGYLLTYLLSQLQVNRLVYNSASAVNLVSNSV